MKTNCRSQQRTWFIVRLPVFVGLILFSFNIYASSQTGKVTKIIVRASDGLTYFYLDSVTPSDKPSCATYKYWMIKDENSEAGKKQYSMLLAAQASGKAITVSGMGTCTRWGDGEDVNAVTLSSN